MRSKYEKNISALYDCCFSNENTFQSEFNLVSAPAQTATVDTTNCLAMANNLWDCLICKPGYSVDTNSPIGCTITYSK